MWITERTGTTVHTVKVGIGHQNSRLGPIASNPTALRSCVRKNGARRKGGGGSEKEKLCAGIHTLLLLNYIKGLALHIGVAVSSLCSSER